MTGEHGSCCCNHDDTQATHDHAEREEAPQPPSANASSGCCGGVSDHTETFASNRRAEQPASAPAAS